jgi:pyruvate carboxylase
MCAKLTIWAMNWTDTIHRGRRALGDIGLFGIKTTIPYYLEILKNQNFIDADFNTSFVEHRVITEDIISQKYNKFTTELNNEQNGYSVTIEYTLKDKNTLILKYTKDLEGEYILTRLY